MRAAEELIDSIVNSSRVPANKRRREIQRELRSHIEDFVAASSAAGVGQKEIEKLVLANFGDPAQIAEGFAWVYRHERRQLGALVFILSTVLLATCLSASVLAMQTGLAFGFGTPIVRVLASRHTVMETLDILASVAAYLGIASLESVFEKHRFAKAAMLLTVIFILIVVSFSAAGLPTNFLFYGLVNGVFCRAVQLFITRKAVRAGIVLVCFSLAGLVSALLRSPASQVAAAATCASWLVMGIGYQLMTLFAARLSVFLKGEIT